jgi:hypothetical protein
MHGDEYFKYLLGRPQQFRHGNVQHEEDWGM